MPLPHRSSACWPQPNVDGVVVPHVGPLAEGKRRELDRRDVCPGDPTGQRRAPDPRSNHPPEGIETLHSRSRLRRVHVPGLHWAPPARVPWPRPAGEFIDIHRAPLLVDTRVWARFHGDDLVITAVADNGPVEVARHGRSTPGTPSIQAEHYPPQTAAPGLHGERTPRATSAEEAAWM